MQSEKPQKLPDTQKYPGGLAVLASIFRKLAEVLMGEFNSSLCITLSFEYGIIEAAKIGDQRFVKRKDDFLAQH